MKTLDPLAGIAAFLGIAETLSFSKAAEALALSRATVSAQVQDLERRLGIRLLQRTTRTVSLTEAGTAYLQALSGVLPQVREAERAATSFQKEAVGRLRVSSAPDLGPDRRPATEAGAGADWFLLENTTGVDTITDFSPSLGDMIQLDAASFGIPAGSSVASYLSFATTAPNAAHGYFMVKSTGISWDPDGSGSTAAKQLATFSTAVSGLTSSNFTFG